MQIIIILIIFILLIKFTGFGALLAGLFPPTLFAYILGVITKVVTFVLTIFISVFEWLKHLVS